MNYFLKIPANFRGTYPTTGKAFILASFIAFTLGGYNWLQASSAQKQLEWRKSQLSLPVYKLSEEEHINPPWNNENINQWLYRRVQVGGRPLHRNACFIYHRSHNMDGYQYIVPLLVRQEKDRSNPQGLLLSKGFIPYLMKDTGNRYRIENANFQTFTGFVSKLPELANQSLLEGNSTDEMKRQFTCSDCQDFAKASTFTNQKQAGVAIVEQLHELGALDERRSQRRAVDCCQTLNYPYAKTQAGALQLPTMPWQYRNDAKHCMWTGVFSFMVGASIF